MPADDAIAASETPPRTTPRVVVVQAQARQALAMAVAFGLAAAAAVFVPHRTGAWLPLHLFLVGSVLLAISGATRLFTVTWSAAEPVTSAVVACQRWAIAVGTAGLAAGREWQWPTGLLAASGLCVTAGLVLLGGLLVVEGRRGRVARFHPARRSYLAAVAFGVVGTGLGAAMVTGRAGLRDAHVIVNLLGLIGLVIAGTLPFFAATQARMRMSPRATPARLHRNVWWLGGTVALGAAAALAHHPALVGLGLAAYAAGLLNLATALPVPGEKQWRWAGPRLAQLAAGLGWWIAVVAVAAARSLAGHEAFPERLVVALVIGAYAQIVVASLAYLGPVLRGGGHQRLTQGFAVTRSWVSLIAVNSAVMAWLFSVNELARLAVAVMAVDVAWRSVLLRRRTSHV